MKTEPQYQLLWSERHKNCACPVCMNKQIHEKHLTNWRTLPQDKVSIFSPLQIYVYFQFMKLAQESNSLIFLEPVLFAVTSRHNLRDLSRQHDVTEFTGVSEIKFSASLLLGHTPFLCSLWLTDMLVVDRRKAA